MAAEHDHLAVDDDGLVVTARLEAEQLLWEAKRDQHVEAFLFHHVATDDADVELLLDVILERADQRAEFGEVVRGAAEIDILVLEPDALLRRLDEL